VPLGANTSPAVTAAAPRRRVWHPAARAPLPPEPGRLETNALVNVARHARGCRTRGDDRLETRAYAVKRLLWRWGHAERSGHYARSIWQLVDGLAPIMGWGPIPPRSPAAARATAGRTATDDGLETSSARRRAPWARSPATPAPRPAPRGDPPQLTVSKCGDASSPGDRPEPSA
jgi:hypothetical protein